MNSMRKKAIFKIIIVFILSIAVLGGCGSSKNFNGTASQEASPTNARVISYDSAGATQSGPARKVTREVRLSIIVADVEAASSQVEGLAVEVEGYVESADIWQHDERKQGQFTLRVPVERLDEVLTRLEALGRVDRKNITGKDVTEEYYDAEARRTTLERQEKRLLELLARAGTVKEMLEIENELTRIRGEIESQQARLKVLDNLTNLATINLELSTSKTLSTGLTQGEPFNMRFKAGWLRGVNGVVNTTEELVILFVIILPYAPVIAVGVYIFYCIRKKLRSKTNEK